jgi:O-antigen biosynthesis protein
MKSSIIIPNYIPDEEVLRKAMDFANSLSRSLSDDVQLALVDNGTSNDLLNRFCQHLYFRDSMRVEIARKSHAIGYARAANIGLALADGEYLFVLNNDLLLPEGWMERMIEEYRRLGPGVLSPAHGPVPGSEPPIASSRSTTQVWEDSWYSLWMTDRKTFAQVGYFDETLPFRFHDQDYSIRMKKAGFKVLRTSAVVVSHEEATTYKKMGIDETEERARMMAKHGVLTFQEWLKK